MSDVFALSGSCDFSVDKVLDSLTNLDKKFNETSKTAKESEATIKRSSAGFETLKLKSSELSNKLQIQERNLMQLDSKYKESNNSLNVLKRTNEDLETRISKLNRQLEKAEKAYGVNSKEANGLREKLNGLKSEYSNNAKAISETENKMQDYSLKMDKAKNSIEKTEMAIKENNKALDNQATTFEKVSNKIKGYASKITSLGKKLTLGVTTPIFGVGVASFKAASDLNENLNKTEVVFGKNTKAVENWSKTSLDAMGMNQSSALEMVSHFGDMSVSMGLTNKQALKYSESLTQLAARFSIF